MIQARSNIANLNAALSNYKTLSRLSAHDILAKQGGKLARALSTALRRAAPSKERIAADAMAVLRSGRGLKIRQSVRDAVEAKWKGKWAKAVAKHEKHFWGDSIGPEGVSKQRELVRREIAVRRSGRGFLSVSSRYPITVAEGQKAISRYGSGLSEVGLKIQDAGGYVRVTWGGRSPQGKSASSGVASAFGQRAVAEAVQSVTDDINAYVLRKQQQLAAAAVRGMLKSGGVK